ncbi:uncharacterized protein LOC144327333 isoform X2 [Podarcis muralis]
MQIPAKEHQPTRLVSCCCVLNSAQLFLRTINSLGEGKKKSTREEVPEGELGYSAAAETEVHSSSETFENWKQKPQYGKLKMETVYPDRLLRRVSKPRCLLLGFQRSSSEMFDYRVVQKLRCGEPFVSLKATFPHEQPSGATCQ